MGTRTLGSLRLDRVTPQQRSAVMSAIRAENTRPELAVRCLLHQLGYRYRLHAADLPGRPDIVFRKRRSVVFIHGCFWHGHKGCGLNRAPQSRQEYWVPKLKANRVRDREAIKRLTKNGWRSLIVWECEISSPGQLAKRLRAFLGRVHLVT